MFDRIRGFSAYGYPQSHAAAFAQLAYQTAWLKRYYPAQFLCAMLNAYPLGFYALDMLIKDAQRHSVLVLSPDVNLSDSKCTMEGDAVRLGLSFVKGVGAAGGGAIEDARQGAGPFRWLGYMMRRAVLTRQAVENLIRIGASGSFGLSRRELLWQIQLLIPGRRLGPRNKPRGYHISLPTALGEPPEFPGMSLWERRLADYQAMELSARYHPMAMLLSSLNRQITSTRALASKPEGASVQMAGMVIARQRTENAKGFCFLTVHDEFGEVDVVVRPPLYDQCRDVVRTKPLVVVRGTVERRRGSLALVAEDLRRLRVDVPDVALVTEAHELEDESAGLAADALRLVAPPSHHFSSGVLNNLAR